MTRTNRLQNLGLCLCIASSLLCATVVAQTLEDPIQGHLDAKEFGEAIQVAESRDRDRDQLLGRIALAQASSGETANAKSTFRRINDVGTLSAATGQLQAARGGANGADFDTLTNLITTTVAPNSWEELGGPGAIANFPGGVFVDAKGVLRKTKTKPNGERADSRLDHKLQLARAQVQQQLASNDPRQNSELRMVSLPRLQRELQLQQSFGEAPSESMRHLAGLREIKYIMLFPETNDLVIAGPAGDWNQTDGQDAPLLLNDLLTLLKNAEEANGQFSCTINPKRSNLADTKRFLSKPTGPLKPTQTKRWVGEIRNTLGLQDIQVRGVDPRSHVAHVLVEADYHMKLVGMGLEPSVPGVPSYLESIGADEIPRSMDVLRWWFTLQSDAIQRNEQGDVFVLADDVVQLQSENELINQAGDRIQTGKSSPLNQQFANRFTKHFDRLANRHPVYARLDSLFRLALVAALVHDDDVAGTIDWNPSWLSNALTTAVGRAAEEVPSIVNHRLIDRRHVVVGVSGGVRVNASHALEIAPRIQSASVSSYQTKATPKVARTSDRWWWD